MASVGQVAKNGRGVNSPGPDQEGLYRETLPKPGQRNPMVLFSVRTIINSMEVGWEWEIPGGYSNSPRVMSRER